MRNLLMALAFALSAPAAPAQFAPPVQMTAPGEGGVRVAEAGLLGNYFPGKGAGKRPAVLVLGGSEGALAPGGTRMARELAALGFSTLHVSYFRAEGQSKALREIPLETFERALTWLAARPEVDGKRLGIVGTSKGAEAALLFASREPRLKAVVAGMPSHVVWPGVDWEAMAPPAYSSWSAGGTPVPYLPYATSGFTFTGRFVDFYLAALKAEANHPAAAIPVEAIKGAVLLVCGEDDSLWPSCPMARAAAARAGARKKRDVTVLAYPAAGHGGFGLPVPKDDPRYGQLDTLGGTDDGNAAAREDGWPKLVAFFTARLKP